MNALEGLNAAAPDEARAMLSACCGSRVWVERMLAERPFADQQALEQAAERIWWELASGDWLEAFAAHPKIGERRTEAPATKTGEAAEPDSSARWSDEEQAGARRAETEIIEALAQANRAYEERFGYIFIVCASGKSGREMLDICRERLGNNPQTELRAAAAEQAMITRLRLRKLTGADN